MRRRSSVVVFGDPNGEMYVVKGPRVLPRMRLKRANSRVPAQTAAAEEIRLWLSGLLAGHGSVTSVDLDPAEDALRLTVRCDGRIGSLAFLGLRSWPNVEPRDNLTNAVRDALRPDNSDLDSEFWLSSYAEHCYQNRRDPTVLQKAYLQQRQQLRC